jgi:hypothetical protein
MVYVSITGLELKSVLHTPVFWWHAARSMGQAKAAPGLISADARQINGVHHTLTVWETEAAMRSYLVTGAHLAAMKAFHGIATGRTVGYLTETAPGWDEVHAIWQRRGSQVRAR